MPVAAQNADKGSRVVPRFARVVGIYGKGFFCAGMQRQ
jgi:hypothetical protein